MEPERRPEPVSARRASPSRAPSNPSGPPPALLIGAVVLALGLIVNGVPKAPPAAPPPAIQASVGPVLAPPALVPYAPAPAAAPDGLRPFDPRDAGCRPLAPKRDLRGARLISRGGLATVTILESEAYAEHDVMVGRLLIGSTKMDVGRTVSIGSLDYGRELEVSIQVRGGGPTFRSGPATRNSDRLPHALLTPAGPKAWRVSFEDIAGESDGDFNDAIVLIRGDFSAESGGAQTCPR